MRVIVTGAVGFVGKWLVDELLYQKDEIVIIVRDIQYVPENWKNKLHIIEMSLQDLDKLEESYFPWEEADIFFHLSWDGTSGEHRADISLQLENIINTCNAVELAEKLKCKRFVNAGSIMEYEAMQYIPLEYAKPGEKYIYSTAKLAADFIAKIMTVNKYMEYINVVISNIYGPGERSERFINSTIRKMLKNEKIFFTHAMQLYDFIYIKDAVKEIILAGKKGERNSVYYIGNGEPKILKYFILQMKEVLHSESELFFGSIPFQGVMLTYKEFDTRKVLKLGFVPEITFEEGIILLQKWILEEEK